MDYARYYLNNLLVLAGIAGYALGGQWVWLGLGTMGVVALADLLSPMDYRERRIRHPARAEAVLYTHAVLMLLFYGAFFWRLHAGFALSGGALALAWTGTLASLVWLTLVPNVGIAHELMHRPGSGARLATFALTAIAGSPNRDVAHVTTHHLHFDTARDTDTGQRGENVYRFVVRCFIGATRDLIEAERRRLRTRGLSPWNWRNRLWHSAAATTALLALAYGVAGWTGFGMLLAAFGVTRFFGEALNYLQHFGLLRAVDEPIGARHTWNHLSWVIRVVGFEITNHVHHHRDPQARWHQLVPQPDGPQQRYILLWFAAALVPPLWWRVIQPELRDWDLHHASPAERELARAANRRAGWPDWLGPQPG